MRGVYIVAFGDGARACAEALIGTVRRFLPGVPVCLAAESPLADEDVLVQIEDGRGSGNDVGGRRAKLKAYDYAPAEWEAVLYLDADTEMVPPGEMVRLLEWIEDGFEFVITKDPHLMDTLMAYRRRYNADEIDALSARLLTLDVMMWNGGVWSFGRGDAVAAFFERWRTRWEAYGKKDQGPLIEAMFDEWPLKVLTLGNEWNTFPKYSRGVETAGLMHYPGRARRWGGQILGRIDGEKAWDAVDAYERRMAGRRRETTRVARRRRRG